MPLSATPRADNDTSSIGVSSGIQLVASSPATNKPTSSTTAANPPPTDAGSGSAAITFPPGDTDDRRVQFVPASVDSQTVPSSSTLRSGHTVATPPNASSRPGWPGTSMMWETGAENVSSANGGNPDRLTSHVWPPSSERCGPPRVAAHAAPSLVTMRSTTS